MSNIIDLARFRETGQRIEVATCSVCGDEFNGGTSRERRRKVRQRRIDAGKPVPEFLQDDRPAKLCPRCSVHNMLRDLTEVN